MKKEFLIPLIVIILTLIFVIVSAMVFLTKGSPYWISKKLKIGALLIGLTAISLSCEKGKTCYTQQPQKPTCYIPKMRPIEFEKSDISLHIENSDISLIKFSDSDTNYNADNSSKPLKFSKKAKIEFAIKFLKSNEYSFKLTDTNRIEIQRGDVIFVSEMTSDSSRTGYIQFDNKVKTGYYILEFHYHNKNEMMKEIMFYSRNIYLKN
jgi:hypothetical protein